MRPLLLLLPLCLLLASAGAWAVPGDVDDDGVLDGLDNCVETANPDQRDENADGFGTACDPDLNDDGTTAPADFFGVLRPCLNLAVAANPQCGIADFDGDGVVSAADFFGLFRPRLGTAPGPKCGACPIAPELEALPDVDLLAGSPLVIPLRGGDALGQAVSYSVTSTNPVVDASVPQGNRSLRILVQDFGEMVFQLFEDLTPRATGRIIELAESGFYDGIIFHRVASPGGIPFVIQAGDPTGTGSGGSTLGDFDDQFSVCLQHNQKGVLSMAKAGDDTNDSQFFVTARETRFLDSNHSIFGILVLGESVRAAIQATPVDANDKPLTPVVMQTVDVFLDDQNGVLLLKAPEGSAGQSTIEVTATDSDGVSTTRSFVATIVPDPFPTSTHPWLADIPVIETTVGTPVSFQLEAIDPDGGDPALFLGQGGIFGNFGILTPAEVPYSVDFNTGLVQVTPPGGQPPGDYEIGVATADTLGAVDIQVVTIRILP